MTCICGHDEEEHDYQGECQAEDCDCWYYEPNEEEKV